METLGANKQEFNMPALQKYVNNHFAYLRAKKEVNATGSHITMTPPVFPGNTNSSTRHSLSNYLRTGGFQARAIASPCQTAIIYPQYWKGFPDHQSIIDELGTDEMVMIGVDPGEKVSAAFCKLDPKTPKQVSNPAVRQGALYSPTLAHKARLEDIKRQPHVRTNLPSSDNQTAWS
ncbi:hypothetical protein B0O80DRAFT_423042 [Mortierella sp. GBAus27b]|nr:hypothetical protein BGX31_003706 [Mortierella sp. GBA43]KAI8360434.1 hypothetical protein B0O80DRAFT_423042 [Mortierella sp. GBAus27b]